MHSFAARSKSDQIRQKKHKDKKKVPINDKIGIFLEKTDLTSKEFADIPKDVEVHCGLRNLQVGFIWPE